MTGTGAIELQGLGVRFGGRPILHDLRARLQAVPKNKQIGYYSDMYKLEFGLPKYNMFRRILAKLLAEDFVKPRVYTEPQALHLARMLLRDNVQQIFKV